MSLAFMYITNDIEIAKILDDNRIDRVWIDLEVLGKYERQKMIDSVKSNHSISDIRIIKQILKNSFMQVRVNPININSKKEINDVIDAGADYIMLPMFRTKKEVEQFIEIVNGRAKTILLFETIESINNIDDILNCPGIDEAHIGLNDLHLELKKDFMFELFLDGFVENISKKFIEKNIPFGIGGISRIGNGTLPAEVIIAEHYRLGSTRAILSRSFSKSNNPNDKIEDVIKVGVDEIRNYESELLNKDERFFIDNKLIMEKNICQIVEQIKESRK